MFIAIAVVVSRIPAPFPPPFGGWLKFDGFPLILSGLMLGPGSGFMVGGLADLLGYMLHATGGYNPAFSLTRALTASIPALVLGRRSPNFPWLLLAIGVGQMLTKALLIPIIRLKMYGFPPLLLSVPHALQEEAFHTVLYAWLALPLLRAWTRYRHNPQAYS